MAFTFIHTADWQIGKPFDWIGPDVAPMLREARLDAIDRIGAIARDAGARDVLVAGDVLDSATARDIVLRQLLQRLAINSHVQWHLLPGNHDPAASHGIWHRMTALGPAANVRLHITPTAMELEPGVLLLPAPLFARASHQDPTAWMDGRISPAGTIRIGLAHGSVHGFGSEGDAAVPIHPTRIDSARLAYLALGDWHGTKRISDRIWYSGTPEPDQFADNEPGHVLAVTVDDAVTPPTVRKIPTAHYTWTRRGIAIAGAADLRVIVAEIDALGPAALRRLLALDITGTLPLADAAEFEMQISRLAGSLRHLQIDRQRLRVVAGDARGSLGSPALHRIATALQASADAGGDGGRIAERALALLAEYAAATGRAS